MSNNVVSQIQDHSAQPSRVPMRQRFTGLLTRALAKMPPYSKRRSPHAVSDQATRSQSARQRKQLRAQGYRFTDGEWTPDPKLHNRRAGKTGG